MPVLPASDATFDFSVPVLIVGAGACGLTAAMAAQEAGAQVLVLERDPVPAGSTALSSGMIPACETRFQKEKGVEDSVDVMKVDILKKSKNEADPEEVEAICRESGPAIDWLADKGVALQLVEGFLYPGHSHLRMHAPPSKTGADLIGNLTEVAEGLGIDIVTSAHVTDVYAEEDGTVCGVRFERPDGSAEQVGCEALVLACNGFGGNPEMVRQYIPEMADALYFGHTGNQGDAVLWGQDLGAAVRDMGAYQGHGSVAHPHGALITWAIMMEGGIQVNAEGVRFSNEHQGYSEQAVAVLEQPGGIAWNVFDQRLYELGQTFEDFRQAVDAGALLAGPSIGELATKMDVPFEPLKETVEAVRAYAQGEGTDPFGRDFTRNPPLGELLYAIRVTGAVFHTQGGLAIDTNARVLREDGRALPNLFAGGGAARGVSGAHVYGYLSGNGLLAAVTLGRIAGRNAGRMVAG